MSTTFGSYGFAAPFPIMIPDPCRKVDELDALLKAEHLTISYPLQFDQLWVSVNWHLLPKEISLT